MAGKNGGVSLSTELHNLGRPLVERQLAHPTVRGIADGSLPEATFRAWLEQDYLFLLDYVRVFSRLAWQAPDAHLGDLVDLAYSTFHDELALHRSMSARYGADLNTATKGKACAAYTEFLLDSAAHYGEGLAALYPCMWGYSTLGQALAETAAPRYRAWVETYADPGFQALTERIAKMIDEADVHPGRARELFLRGMEHEIAFWDVTN